MNTIFHPVNPVSDRNLFIFKVTVFIKRAKYEYIPYCMLPSAYSRVNPQAEVAPVASALQVCG